MARLLLLPAGQRERRVGLQQPGWRVRYSTGMSRWSRFSQAATNPAQLLISRLLCTAPCLALRCMRTAMCVPR